MRYIFISNLLNFYYYFSMRLTSSSPSPDKSLKLKKYSPSPSKLNRRPTNEQLYFHYNNAIYMGGMVSYKRNGNGILLIDDGTSMISQYCFDTMTGHNIIFRQNYIISILFLKNNMYEIVIRTGYFILKIPFYERDNVPYGSGLLIDYQLMKMYHILFEGGRIEKKIVESDTAIMEKVMNQQLSTIIGRQHQHALKFNIKYDNGIKIMKEGKKITIGFIDSRHYIEGIGFKMKINQSSVDDFSNPLQLKFIERGFYNRNRLQSYGQRYFSNGNAYIGQFKDDMFNGQGLLLYPHEQKWVYGAFESDKLTQMININLPQNDTSKPQSVKSCLRSIHQYNHTKNWISNDIEILPWKTLRAQINQIINFKITDVVVQKSRVQKESQDRLIRIQEHFIIEEQSSNIDKIMKQQINKNTMHSQKVVINEYSSLRPKVMQIQPKNTQNQEYWSQSAKIEVVVPSSRKNNTQLKISKYQTQSHKSISPPNKRASAKSGLSPTKRFNYCLNV